MSQEPTFAESIVDDLQQIDELLEVVSLDTALPYLASLAELSAVTSDIRKVLEARCALKYGI